jgi:hypothetical protein
MVCAVACRLAVLYVSDLIGKHPVHPPSDHHHAAACTAWHQRCLPLTIGLTHWPPTFPPKLTHLGLLFQALVRYHTAQLHTGTQVLEFVHRYWLVHRRLSLCHECCCTSSRSPPQVQRPLLPQILAKWSHFQEEITLPLPEGHTSTASHSRLHPNPHNLGIMLDSPAARTGLGDTT